MNLFDSYLAVIYKTDEESYFKRVGYVSCENNPITQGHILVSGLNPAEPIDGVFEPKPSYPNPFLAPTIGYFSKLRKMIPENLVERTAYLDIFPFFEKDSNNLLSNIRGKEPFVANVLQVTQAEIESIAPKLLIIANKLSYAFWGAIENCVWMGYNFVRVEKCDLPVCFQDKDIDVRIIRGLRTDDLAKTDIIFRPADRQTNLRGSVAVMYKHSRGLSASEMLNPADIQTLYDWATDVKKIVKYI